MSAFILPVLFAAFVWWFGTGLVLYLDRLPRRVLRPSQVGITLLAIAAVYGIVATSAQSGVAAAYTAFVCAIVLWSWHEATFLFGLITGPRRAPCPPGAHGWLRFKLASATVLYHEIALAVTVVALIAVTWGEPNQFGTMTFALLWAMRLSAKLNVFLGVPHLTEEFLPAHIAFMKSYFGRRPMNMLFPVSVTVTTTLVAYLVFRALADGASAFDVAGFMLVASLAALALIEHWLLVLPVRDAALWQWFAPARRGLTDTGLTAEDTGSARSRDRISPDQHDSAVKPVRVIEKIEPRTMVGFGRHLGPVRPGQPYAKGG